MVIVIGLKFYLAQALHLCLTFEVKGFIYVIEFFQCYNITYSIQLPSPVLVGGICAPLGTLSSLEEVKKFFIDGLTILMLKVPPNMLLENIEF